MSEMQREPNSFVWNAVLNRDVSNNYYCVEPGCESKGIWNYIISANSATGSSESKSLTQAHTLFKILTEKRLSHYYPGRSGPFDLR